MKGKFITLEGIEGSGKSTNLQSIKTILDQKKIDFSKDYLKNALFFIDKYKVEKDSLSLYFINIFIEKFYKIILLSFRNSLDFFSLM